MGAVRKVDAGPVLGDRDVELVGGEPGDADRGVEVFVERGAGTGALIPDSQFEKAGAKLTDAQYDSFKAGNLYVNVHSAANKGGEIRAQLKP